MSNDLNPPLYDVIISGAGPVGLFLACELALAKCSVLVLEKTPDPQSPMKKLPFGVRGLSTPTVEALDRRGLLQELAVPQRIKPGNPHAAKEPQRPQAGHFARIPFHQSDVDTMRWKYRLPGSADANIISEMEENETVLSRRAEALGVLIKRGVAVTDFQQTADGVIVRSEKQAFQGQWLVGCDGGRSVVRKVGGFDFAGTEPDFTGYTVKADIADPEKLKPGQNLTATGMYLQSQPGFLIIQEFDGGACHTGEPVTLEHIQGVLRRVSGTEVTITALHVAATWTDRARQVTAYRNGRVLLAGDAAHIHSPLGGQGLNLGLGDAMNLGWKLAATLHHQAPNGLLDSYHAERHPLGLQVLDWSRAQVAIMRPDAHARALNTIFRDLLDTRDGATYCAGKVWGVAMRYDFGGGHPLVGCSVPNFEMENGTKVAETMRAGQWVLLDFDTSGLLQDFASKYGDRMKYVAGLAKEQLGLGAVLVRPDGFVVWASDGKSDGQSIKQAADRWLTS